MAFSDGQSSVLLDNVSKLIHKKVKGKQRPLVEIFASKLYRNMSKDDLVNRHDSDLYGAALSLWHSFNQQPIDGTEIRVFNPELSRHGWESSHTIIEIIVRDMPFLVDSVRMALNRMGIASHLLLHCPMAVNRNAKAQVTDFIDDEHAAIEERQTVFLVEVDRQKGQTELDEVTAELNTVVVDLCGVVDDWQPIRDKLLAIIDELPKSPNPNSKAEINEALDFLNWMADDNFTLMGYRHYDVVPIKGDYKIEGNRESSLGLMKNSKNSPAKLYSDFPESARNEALSNSLLMLTKTNSKSRVHRPAYIDYVGIKRFDKKGNVIGEDRFLGLYSASFYNDSAVEIPLLKHKLGRVMTSSGFIKGSHAYKALLNILETYPRDELIQASVAELTGIAMGVLQMQERDMTRLFVRKDIFGRFISCMVYVPRERYNTQLRRDTQAVLQKAFDSDEYVEFTTYFSESVLARTHYIVRVKNNNSDVDVNNIEQNLLEAATTWEDKLGSALLGVYGESKGKALRHRYARAFPPSYKEMMLPSNAVVDIQKLESLTADNKLAMLFYTPQEEESDSKLVRMNLFHLNEMIHLSDVLPILENFGLRVIGETPHKVTTLDGEVKWVLDFSMLHDNSRDKGFEAAQQRFQDAFVHVWNDQLEDDGFNRLVLGANLTGREASIIRAYAKYLRQIGGTFSQTYIENIFSNYPNISGMLVQLFKQMFDPERQQSDSKVTECLDQLSEQLELVANLDDDRIIRRYIEMISATQRTNYFQLDDQGNTKPYISFKVLPELIPEMPLPLPKYEVFVYSPRVEGVHLRGGKVARGGLRWSDRREDFRTEVLGLVKAQQVKNTVIVPVGAKGGFVCKKLPTTGGRDAMFEEGKSCYRTFIRGLLDITDNILAGKVIPPKQVVRRDEDDIYLVVAADKGTATFSDMANGIAEEYNFWLGDAFASGGSVGYDHKKMGITAKGAWESVKRHFRELGIDCQSTDFTCLAIGDMAGDVFGNGMLLSEHTQLVVAFNHMHIFIDPTPDAAKSFVERQRLFVMPRSSWEDYSKELISKGGGIFARSAKSIDLTPEIQKMLDTTKSTMAPNELIGALLRMKVDLIWNGGIGTYVKGKMETHAEVGDRANDSLRINGEELNAKIFGEGGNLGLTQLGRVEFAANGGRINTDFVDNVGGVDCSDNEVNIKILLNTLVVDGELTRKQRDQLLFEMTDEVSELVLVDCYRQTQSITITHSHATSHLKEHLRFIHALEKDGSLNRELEFLPSDEELSDRRASGKGLTRPEISVLVSYGKMVLKEWLLIPEITENNYFNSLLVNSFPKVLGERFSKQMDGHPLRAEIIATKLANDIINDMGLNFVHRMLEETGASVGEIATSYVMSREVFEMPLYWSKIEALDNKIPAIVQTEMLFQLRRTVRRATRWFLRHRDKSLDIEQTIAYYRPSFEDLSANIEDYLVETEKQQLLSSELGFSREGVPDEIAKRISLLSTIYSALDIAQIAEHDGNNISHISAIYFNLGAKLDLHWFLDQITNQPVGNHWQALARASYREELDWQQRSIASVVIRSCNIEGSKDACASDIVSNWILDHDAILERWRHILAEFKTSQNHEFAKFSVALRELMLLSHNCDPSH
ncbi:MAG: NAD-glutamate dehydrogenase [Algicola sp.]|nr:NAD-glutamate dehydrogenase [Algicola sp.]